METYRHSSLLHGCVMFVFLATISKACERPSSPQCFRRNEEETVYTCEWSLNTTEENVTFDLHINKTLFPNIRNTSHKIRAELLIRSRSVDIWVVAHIGNSSCMSPRRSVTLKHIVKYEAPRNILVSWGKNKNNLILRWPWPAAESYPAVAEVCLRRDGHPSESWETRLTNVTINESMYQINAMNLMKDSVYQVKIRQRSNKCIEPLWSDWSSVVIVPAELEEKPEITTKIRRINGIREVTLTWRHMPSAAAVKGVTYNLSDTQSSHGCPCMNKKTKNTEGNNYTMYVSYSAVNISVFAKNDAGESPKAIVQVPAEPAEDLKICDNTSLKKKITRGTCLELYEAENAALSPKNVITLTARNKGHQTQVKDYIRYLYFEHTCDHRKPRTVKRCFFYQKEGVPIREPQDFLAYGETDTSVDLSWKAISYTDQRGFQTHYNLCRVKITSRDDKECFNISTSKVKYHLDKLTPSSEYIISLAAVTRVGEGPQATLTINTKTEKSFNVSLSFGLVVGFFLLSTMCTFIWRRIKDKIFPPVPKPVIPEFNPCRQETQVPERKETVDDLTLHHLDPGEKSNSEMAEVTTFTEHWNDGSNEEMQSEGSDSEGSINESLNPGSTRQALRSSREREVTEIEQVDTELAMLIYKNGLVFDMKAESP
ncbi:leukemia inhibitory factor receptor isoform 2-T2 [Pholidichthys leucotaenia]